MPQYLKYAFEAGYVVLVMYTVTRILLDTHSSAKTLAYLLLVIIVPLAGVIFYFALGMNYRNLAMTTRGLASQEELADAIRKNRSGDEPDMEKSDDGQYGRYDELARFISHLGEEGGSANDFHLLINGEEKFPAVLETLETAKQFIHMEYYAWENDTRGNQIKDLLLRKSAEGVKVRIIFDDYASWKIKRNIVRALRKGGVDMYPMIPVKFFRLASRINHRDHRKVIIIDGRIGYIGGINISDRYDNSIESELYWRDTHMKITGGAVLNLQRHFIIHWNACQDQKMIFQNEFFPTPLLIKNNQEYAQIVAGGPIFPLSKIMLTYFKIFALAKEKLYITTPYFIPCDSILDALKEAAISGKDVRLILPYKADSIVVGAASKFYFRELLQTGVKIYLYKKGFVHAKTVVADGFLSVVGTANMDIRSFDLNFEIMAVIYGKTFGRRLEEVFIRDLKDCEQLSFEAWSKTRKWRQFLYAVARLVSELL